MKARLGFFVGLFAACIFQEAAALCEQRWVDDEAVLFSRQVQLKAGLGIGLLSAETATRGQSSQMYYSAGGGLNVEGAIGLGAGIEVGARLGHRVVSAGRGMRGDEIARLNDTETYGTGLDDFPNPELRTRWRAYRWAWGEAGIENRLAPPLEAERIAAEVIGVWTSLHIRERARLDVGVNGVFTWRWFAGGTVLEPGLGVPLRLWTNLTRGTFVGFIASPQHFGSTTFTSAHTELLMGIGAGYRFRRCDIIGVMSSRDVLSGLLTRTGLGMGVSCRI